MGFCACSRPFQNPWEDSKISTGSGVSVRLVSDLHNNYPHLSVFLLDIWSEPLGKLKTLTGSEVFPFPILNGSDRISRLKTFKFRIVIVWIWYKTNTKSTSGWNFRAFSTVLKRSWAGTKPRLGHQRRTLTGKGRKLMLKIKIRKIFEYILYKFGNNSTSG